MKENLLKTLKKEICNDNFNIFLCIGTTKCIGDSLGPKVGEILYKNIKKDNICVLGNIQQNIDYNNINIVLKELYNKVKNPYLIVIDSALGDKKYIGNIIANKKQMVIGNGLNKKGYKLGNISIKGIIGEDRKDEIKNFKTLNNISNNIIEKLSYEISNQIINVIV